MCRGRWWWYPDAPSRQGRDRLGIWEQIMDQGRALLLSTLSVLATAAMIGGAGTPPAPGSGPTVDTAEVPPQPFDAPLGRPPLAPPLVITGGFGEYRVGHFHAAFDFGTGGVVGKP